MVPCSPPEHAHPEFECFRTVKPSAVKKNAAALQDAIAAEAEDAAAGCADCEADGAFASLPEAVYKASALALERRVADGRELTRDQSCSR